MISQTLSVRGVAAGCECDHCWPVNKPAQSLLDLGRGEFLGLRNVDQREEQDERRDDGEQQKQVRLALDPVAAEPADDEEGGQPVKGTDNRAAQWSHGPHKKLRIKHPGERTHSGGVAAHKNSYAEEGNPGHDGQAHRHPHLKVQSQIDGHENDSSRGKDQQRTTAQPIYQKKASQKT